METIRKQAGSIHFWWRILPFVGIMVWGAFCITNNLWYDEAYSASMVSLPWMRLVYITAVDDHSPFYYFLLKVVYDLSGGGTHFQSLKLLSLLFMTGYLFLGKYYVKKLFDEKVSVYFMFISLTMPIMSVQAGNVRMYGAALFFFTLMGLCACDIYREAHWKKWLVFTGAAVCSVYCHTFAMIQAVFIFLLFLGAILVGKRYRLLKGYFLSGTSVSILYSPWLWVTWRQMQLRIQNDSGGRSLEASPTLYTFMDYCKEWFSALETPIPFVVFGGMGLTLFLGYYAIDRMRREKRYEAGMGLAAIGLCALTGALVSVYINPCFLGRYAFPGFGSLALFLAVGMSNIESVKLRRMAMGVAILLFALQYRSELELEYDKGLQVYEQFWEEHVGPEDCIVAPGEHTVFLNVYHPDHSYFLYGYKLYSLPFVNTEAFLEWPQLTERQGNIWYICFQGDEPSQMSDYYTYEKVLEFHYMYYDFVIYRLDRL